MVKEYAPNQTQPPAPRGPRPVLNPSATSASERVAPPGPLTQVSNDVRTIRNAAVLVAVLAALFAIVTFVLGLFIVVGVHNLQQDVNGQTPCQIIGAQGC